MGHQHATIVKGPASSAQARAEACMHGTCRIEAPDAMQCAPSQLLPHLSKVRPKAPPAWA